MWHYNAVFSHGVFSDDMAYKILDKCLKIAAYTPVSNRDSAPDQRGYITKYAFGSRVRV